MHRYYFRSYEQMHHTGVKRGCGAWCMGCTLHALFPFFCKLEIALKIFIEEKKKVLQGGVGSCGSLPGDPERRV